MPCARATRPENTQPAAPCDPGPDPLACEVDGLLYRLDALPLRHGKKSVLSVRLADGDGGPALIDRADLYSFRSRRASAQLVADALTWERSQPVPREQARSHAGCDGRSQVFPRCSQGQVLGHQRVSTTHVYLGVSDEDLREAIARLDLRDPS